MFLFEDVEDVKQCSAAEERLSIEEAFSHGWFSGDGPWAQWTQWAQGTQQLVLMKQGQPKTFLNKVCY